MQFATTIYLVMFFFGIYFLLLLLLLYYKNKKSLYDYPKPKKFPSISFLVPAYNEQNSIETTIKSLVDLDYPKEKKEIIVINDGSTDKTQQIAERLAKKYPQVKVLNKKNSGKADSLNQAIKIAKGELIAVTDADSYPEKDSLIKMVGYFEQDEKVAAVTSRVLVKNPKNFIERYQAFDYVVIAWGRKVLDYIDSVYVTNGPLSVYKKSAVKEVGGFDTKNLTEDIEITWNLLSHGYKTKMSYSTKVYTTVPSKFKQWNKQRTRWNLGGIQTLWKYRKNALRGENLFGYFVVTYVALSFFFALVGIGLFVRYLWLKVIPNFFTFILIFKGYNPLKFIDLNFPLTLLTVLGAIFFILALVYYKASIKNAELKNNKITSILIYILIYRALYAIPLLISLYKIVKRDIRWYTK